MSRIDVRPEVVSDVAVRALPRRQWGWPGKFAAVVGVGAACTGIEGLLGSDELIPVTIVATIIVAAVVVVFGVRRWKRGRSIDKMIEAVNAVIRVAAPTRGLVRVSRWRGGWIGYPGRITVYYPADIIDSDPKFLETLSTQITNRMGLLYRIKKNNSRSCVVVLEVDTNAQAEDADRDQTRMESIAQSVIPGMLVKEIQRDASDDSIERIELKWPAGQTARVSKRFFQKQLTDAIQIAVGEPFSIEFDFTKERGVAAPLTPFPDVVPHPPRNDDEPMQVDFGRFRDGSPCIWDLDAPLPHVLIVGGTGGGKTVLLLSLLTALPNGLRRDTTDDWVAEDDSIRVEIWPIDPKRLGLFNLDLIPGAKRAATRESVIVDYILAVKNKMDARYEYLESNGPHLRSTLDPLVLVVDEGEEMVDMLNDWWRSGDGKRDWCERFNLEKPPSGGTHPVMTAFGSILRLGREGRVHVILASQQAASTWLNTSSRSQFAVRIALRNLEQSTSMMTFGSLVATQGLENTPGRAWVSVGMGAQPEHAQIYWTPKLAPGLNDSDRAILHGLGILLPDDPNFVSAGDTEPPQLDDAPVFDEDLDQDAPTQTGPDLKADSKVRFTPDGDEESDRDGFGLKSFEIPAAELELGMQILVDIDGISRRAEVDSVDIDPDDPDCLRISYTTEEGESQILATPEAESITALLDQ